MSTTDKKRPAYSIIPEDLRYFPWRAVSQSILGSLKWPAPASAPIVHCSLCVLSLLSPLTWPLLLLLRLDSTCIPPVRVHNRYPSVHNMWYLPHTFFQYLLNFACSPNSENHINKQTKTVVPLLYSPSTLPYLSWHSLTTLRGYETMGGFTISLPTLDFVICL